ncbi:hypothetical protein AA313_de0204005 [Arthrobotrys entomopaga]|nr:hypothetical protein AA313_de0204005 [Arthrobotrys entomopaga]
MTEVMYPLAFSQDYEYLGMPKRRASTYGIPHPGVDDAQEYGILDERQLFKQDISYLNTPRTSQQFQLDVSYSEGSVMPYPYSGVETSTIPAGFSDFMPSPEQSIHAFPADGGYMSPNMIGSIPMQHQLSHESIQYYNTPMSPSGVSDSAIPNHNINDSFNFSGALSSTSYSHLHPNDGTKLQPPDISIALQRTLSGGRIAKPKRQFTSATEAVYTCNVDGCGKHFKRIWNYKAHQETHNPEREKPWRCSIPACGKSFVRKTDKERHETCVHTKKKEWRCPLCSSMFARKDTLRR